MPTLHLVSVSSVRVHEVERVSEIETNAAGWPTGYCSIVVRAVHPLSMFPLQRGAYARTFRNKAGSVASSALVMRSAKWVWLRFVVR